MISFKSFYIEINLSNLTSKALYSLFICKKSLSVRLFKSSKNEHPKNDGVCNIVRAGYSRFKIFYID